MSGMPAKSKKQQRAAGAALAANRGEKSKSSLKGALKRMAESMSETPLKDLLPEDNIGAALNVSSVLMERYLEAADVADSAMALRTTILAVSDDRRLSCR
jgi:hypothetical protein